MTAINVVSSIIYTKGAPFREKIQTFALAGIFLVLLYNSPSGLVFYWLLNQIFSLCKNIFKRISCSGKIIYCLFSLSFILLSVYVALYKRDTFFRKRLLVYVWTLVFIIAPFVYRFIKSKKLLTNIKSFLSNILDKQWFSLFVVSCLSLWLLSSFVLPSSIIATSPSEFSFLGNTESPVAYILSAMVYFFGLFVFWPLVIYKMFGEKTKIYMSILFCVLALCALANVLLFKYNYGTMTIYFRLDDSEVLKNFSFFFSLLPLLFMFFVIFAIFILAKHKRIYIAIFLTSALCISEFIVGISKIQTIKKDFEKILVSHSDGADEKDGSSSIVPEFHFSKTEPNVVVLFLDKAVSTFFPYIIEQFPDMKNSYDGFVYYPNTLSFAQFTYTASPALMGGYDYCVDEINKRSDKYLKDKHNEAILTMPKLFADAGFETTVYYAPYINYNLKPIPSIFDFTNLKSQSQKNINKFKKSMLLEFANSDEVCSKTMKLFVITEMLYPPVRTFFSNETKYYIKDKFPLDEFFVDNYASLYYLAEDFEVDSSKPTYNLIVNDTAHNYVILREGYEPGVIDSEHPAAGTGNFKCKTENEIRAYHVNAATHIQTAKFLDALKEKGIYDNTRIIIVGDHGGPNLFLPPFEKFEIWSDAAYLNPLLLYKDFNMRGELKVDSSLRTNAETVGFAIKDLPISDVHPFTKNKIKRAEDFDGFNVYILDLPAALKDYSKKNFTIKGKRAYKVRDNIFDEKNWMKLDTSEAME